MQVNKQLMNLVITVVFMFKPGLNVILGGDVRQIPCPPEFRSSPATFFFQAELWQELDVKFIEVSSPAASS